MSVKLGNTNIAGTQVLYSTTGNNTDGAMTQAATTTALNNKADNSVVNLKANDNAVVHLTGNETISGVKTFNNAINFANGTWNAVGDDAFIGDFNHAGAVCIKGNNGKTQLKLINRSETIGLGFFIDEDDGNALKLINPTYSATAWGSVTGMVVQNFNTGKGYVKYNNGLIIQWGLIYHDNNNLITSNITFDTPFSHNYPIVSISKQSQATNVWSAIENTFNSYVYNLSSTGFTISTQCPAGGYTNWIAIGY